MTDQQWQQAWEIYRTARELPDDQRRSYVASVSADPEVFEQVILLIEEQVIQPPAAPELKAGTIIGRYEVLGILGTGGMGQVYAARDSELGRTLALKVLAPEVVATRPAVDRLVREAKAASGSTIPISSRSMRWFVQRMVWRLQWSWWKGKRCDATAENLNQLRRRCVGAGKWRKHWRPHMSATSSIAISNPKT